MSISFVAPLAQLALPGLQAIRTGQPRQRVCVCLGCVIFKVGKCAEKILVDNFSDSKAELNYCHAVLMEHVSTST